MHSFASRKMLLLTVNLFTIAAISSRADSTLMRAAEFALLLPNVPEACAIGMAPTTSTMMALALGDALSVALMHQQIEAMKIAVHAANEHFADERAMYLTPEQLLAPGSLERAAKRIGDRAAPLPPVSLPVGEDTVYLTTADSDGMMVSFIQSNFRAFGLLAPMPIPIRCDRELGGFFSTLPFKT